MDYFARFYALNRVHQRSEQRGVIFHSVPLDVNNNDSESDLLEIVFVLKTLISGYKNVTLALSQSDQPSVREGAPMGFGNGHDLFVREGLTQAGIYALV